MNICFGRRSTQRGAALILLMTVIVVGIAWYTVGALQKAAWSTSDKEIRTGAALYAAKRALLSYLATEAAQPDTAIPGRLPCPEPLNPAAGNEGIAAGCSNNTATYVGRLPWRTLGVDQIRDGDGELLWYILGPGFRQSPINFGSQNQIQLDVVNNQAVALIIAPGAPLNTVSEASSPPSDCPRVNEFPRPVVGPFNPSQFLECGRDTTPPPGTQPQYNTDKTSPWTNDRIIIVTAADIMDAIAGPIADRVQRLVMPALETWDAAEASATGKSWGTTWSLPYLPFASTFGIPASNDYCGDASSLSEGLPPTAMRSSSACNTDWGAAPSVSTANVQFVSCTQDATSLVCQFRRVGGPSPAATIVATASKAAGSFRGTITASDISAPLSTTKTLGVSASAATGNMSATINVSWPTFIPTGTPLYVTMPDLPDARVLSDSRVTWFLNNNWQQYTYYAVAPGATVNPTTPCASAGDPGCLTVNGLPSPNTPNDKRLVLVLMGRSAVASELPWPTGNAADYLESHTAGTNIYTVGRISSNFNDRIAACPFQYATQSSTLSLCN